MNNLSVMATPAGLFTNAGTATRKFLPIPARVGHHCDDVHDDLHVE